MKPTPEQIAAMRAGSVRLSDGRYRSTLQAPGRVVALDTPNEDDECPASSPQPPKP